jgi:hypothetical protein
MLKSILIPRDSWPYPGGVRNERRKDEEIPAIRLKNFQLSSHISMSRRSPERRTREADRLARIGSAQEEELESSEEQVRLLPTPTILDGLKVCEIRGPPEWAKEIFRYITEGQLPADRKAAARIRLKASKYTVHRRVYLPSRSNTTTSQVFVPR